MINLIIGLIIGSIIGIFLMCLLQINRDNELKQENFKLQARSDKYKCRINRAMDYINFLVIFNENINGKFNETIWGEELLEILGGDVD